MSNVVQDDSNSLFTNLDEDVDEQLKNYYDDYIFMAFHANAMNEIECKRPLQLLFLGDSIARGVGSSAPYPFLRFFLSQLQRQ